jgi:hypothetical protein
VALVAEWVDMVQLHTQVAQVLLVKAMQVLVETRQMAAVEVAQVLLDQE